MRRAGQSTQLTISPRKLWLYRTGEPHPGPRSLGPHGVSLAVRRSSTKANQRVNGDRLIGILTDAARQKGVDRDLFLDVLNATASKREAKSYLANFKPKPAGKLKKTGTSVKPESSPAWGNEVNLGSLYLPVRSVDQSPKFSQHIEKQKFSDPQSGPLRTALVLMRLDDDMAGDRMLESLGRTFSQLARLGLVPVVVIDNRLSDGGTSTPLEQRSRARQQAARMVTAIESVKGQRAGLIDSGFHVTAQRASLPASVKIRGRVRLSDRHHILKLLRRNAIPVIAPLGFDDQSHSIIAVPSSEAVLAIARDFAGLATATIENEKGTERPISLDRLIVLDSNGGIPWDKSNSWHVFINLEQEYDSIRSQLSKATIKARSQSAHLANLQLAKDVLSLLPPTSSAFITTPAAAANAPRLSSDRPGVGTRATRNPLIHNLLTDKPVFSPSLPASRLSTSLPDISPEASRPPTFLKRGMPVTIFPSPFEKPWTHHSPSNPPFRLSSPQLDIPRLIHLIEDSFRRPLDAKSYFARIAPRLAGIIVAGAYEGCAILTWEQPTSGSQQNTSRPEHGGPADGAPDRSVPYLDKFAVLQRSQGAGGVADILFNAMVRDCFPNGVVWRSRSDNPVNKWYFERARGSWKIPGAGKGGQSWTMFWTTRRVEGWRFRDYEDVCRSIGTSWADGKKALD